MEPTNTLLIGDPLAGVEARFLRQLYADLFPHGALILANFHVGHRQIDFVVAMESYAAILELKNITSAIGGGENGPWWTVNGSGRRESYPGENPYRQTLDQKFALSDAIARYRAGAPAGASTQKPFKEFDAFVCVYPELHPQSTVTRGDRKVTVASYARVLEALRTTAKASPWTRADWARFAQEHLGLVSATPDEATDPAVRLASESVHAYLGRAASVFGHELPPQLAASVGDAAGQPLIESLLDERNHVLVGPSGSAKTFHLHHLALASATRGDEVPIYIEPKAYHGGEIWTLVRRAVAPMFPGDAKGLLDAVTLCGKRPLLIVDALNECPRHHADALLRGVQAFVLRFDARVVLVAQSKVDLPDALAAATTQMRPLSRDHKRQIYCYHAGLENSTDVGHLCEAFNTAYDLTVAGRCHRSGAPAATRVELFDRYARAHLPEHFHVLVALLREVAAEMSRTVSSTYERARFEQWSERFVNAHGGSLGSLDVLRSCRLIRFTDDFVSFEHELLADYFAALELHRKGAGTPELVAELRKPRNQRLMELILPRLTDDEEIDRALTTATDRATLELVLSGRCGPQAKEILLRQIQELMSAATRDLPNLVLRWQISDLEGGRHRLDCVSIDGSRSWSTYSALLCKVIAHNLDDASIAREFLELLDVSEWTLRGASESVAAASGIKPRRVWEETFRRYGGVLGSSLVELPCTEILLALRDAVWQNRYPAHTRVWRDLYDRATGVAGSHFALLALLHDRGANANADLEALLTLARLGWDSKVYNLRLDCLHLLRSMHRSVSPGGASRIGEMLQTFDTNNLFLNTALFETLSAYGLARCDVTVEDALQEMQSLIAPGAVVDPSIVGAASAQAVEPRALLASHANGCLARMFEEVFGDAYFQAYFELSSQEKCDILTLATASPDVRYHSDWVLSELLLHSGQGALPVFERFASQVDGESWSAQDATATFVLAMEGCARWRTSPPPYVGEDSPAHRAWATIGQILFWTYKPAPVPAVAWAQITGPTALAVGDALYRIEHCKWKLSCDGKAPVDLLSRYANELRPVVEACLRDRGSLPSVFGIAHHDRRQVLSYLVGALGSVGDNRSAFLLRELIDDPELGLDAIRAIDAIQNMSQPLSVPRQPAAD